MIPPKHFVFATLFTKSVCGWRDLIHSKEILSAENQKGINAVQECSDENQKGAITIDFVQR